MVVPAESTEAALARHTGRSGTLAIPTGRFPAHGEKRGDLVRRFVEGLDLETELAIVHRKADISRPVHTENVIRTGVTGPMG
jgi:hypothetical protein